MFNMDEIFVKFTRPRTFGLFFGQKSELRLRFLDDFDQKCELVHISAQNGIF